MGVKKLSCFLAIILLTVISSFLVDVTDIQADPPALSPFNSNDVPSGVAGDKVIDPYDEKTTTIFRPLTYDNGSGLGNSNKFLNGTNNPIAGINNGFSTNPINHGGGYLSLWTKSNHAGVMWSNDAYKMDLDKDQYFSFWFWGSDQDMTTKYSNGGIAFAIQNDPRQQNAYSYDNVNGTATTDAALKLSPAESLGLFAADQNVPHLGSAVKNSWALSIDSYDNKSGNINDSFDKGVYQGVPITGQVYLSTSYPGEADSYLPFTTANGTTAYTIPRTAVDTSNMSLANGVGMWHHLRLLYQAPKDGGNQATMTYWFNDIYTNGSSNTNSGPDSVDTQANPRKIQRTTTIDLSKLHVTQDSDGKRLVRWGLTYRDDAATTSGGSFVIENASPVMNVSVEPEVIDVTQDNRVLTDDNEYVNSGDQLIFRNVLNYNRGVTNWTNIKSVIGVPTGTILNKSNYGNVTYGTGSNTSSVAIQNATVSGAYMSYALTKGLAASETTTTSPHAVMDVNMSAQAADNTDVKVPGITSYFNGDYYVGTTTSKSFIIRGKQTKDLQLSINESSPIKAFNGGNVNISGSLKYGDDSAFVSPGASIYLNVNGSDKSALTVPVASTGDKSIDISDAVSQELTKELKNNELNVGDNQVTIYARDSLGNVSNKVSLTINVSDQSVVLDLDSNGYSFKDIQALYSGLVERKGDWKVNVDAVNSAWNLSASASSLEYTDALDQVHAFDGGLVYKKGNEIQAMDVNVPISSSADNTGTSTTIIGQNWLSDEGILLQSDGKNNTKGKYTGTIFWDLVQGP